MAKAFAKQGDLAKIWAGAGHMYLFAGEGTPITVAGAGSHGQCFTCRFCE